MALPKVCARQSMLVFSFVILALLMLCVGLLVAVLKGQVYHENTLTASSSSSHRIGVTTMKPGNGHNPAEYDTANAVQTDAMENNTEPTTEFVAPKAATWENFRLSSHVRPLHYDILLHPDLEKNTFYGHVKVTINLTKYTDHLVMHAFRLNVFHPKVYNLLEHVEVPVRHTFLYDPNEFYVMELDNLLRPGVYEISLDFTGSLADKIVGFYKSRYRDQTTNETRYLATSKFQPTYARRAFPCFDEPAFKSTFTVSLVHDPSYIALSNMPVDETVPYLDGDLKVTKFQKSVPMVTYLTCFIVCDFDYVRTVITQGKEFRVYAAKDNIEKAEFALNFGSEVLKYYETYFDIPYALPKQDMVAIPDFVSGATEHWGVITFRETNILYNAGKSSPQNKQRICAVISHEMAHMWFGNLMTMEWWDDLWLNEGFASYIEYKGINKLYPEWHMLEQFVSEDMQPVMDLDSTLSSHPIVQSVNHADEITEIFDDISYNKGASVLRMLEFFIGEETFREGISRFLKKYSFDDAKTEDLWAELSLSSLEDLNISRIMGTWTQQMGFPFVSITRDPKNSSLFTAQPRRFVKNREVYKKFSTDDEYTWCIPLSYTTSKGDAGMIWLHNNSVEEFHIPVKEDDWVKFNINQTGYYIVNYNNKEWERLIQLLKSDHEALTPADRSNLIFDAFLLAEAGHIEYDVLLNMISYLKNETHLVPWETAYASLVYLSKLLESSEVDLLIKRYIKDLTEPLYRKLGWEESENHLDNLLRNTIIGLACHSGNQDCLKKTTMLLEMWTRGFKIPTTFRQLVYHYGMAESGEEEIWNLMWERYLNEDSAQERKTLLYGLSHVRVPALIHRFLDYAMNESQIRRQDFSSVLNYLAGNPAARHIVWNFLRNKWEALVERFTLNDRSLGASVKRICSPFTSEDELREMKRFFKKYPDAGAGTRRRQQALENVENNLQWLRTYQNQMRTWFLVESPAPWLHYKLPPHIIPHHYDLLLHPKIENLTFSGSVSIDVELKIPSNYILIHSRNLNISSTRILQTTMMDIEKVEDHSEIVPSNIFAYENNTYWVIQFPKKIAIGFYKLSFEFTGNFSDFGMYKKSYLDADKNQRTLIATQFQDTYARNVFPCFDEPTFKATFNLSILHEPENKVLSNGIELESKSYNSDLMITKFEKTVPMVTYLVCIVIGDIDFKETYTDNGARFRVYAVSHNVEKTEFALKTGKALLSFFEEYFGCPYPLKKLDFVAIPGAKGGMENWGLVTFGEDGFLIDNSSSLNDIQDSTNIISHELAHMWFGNLVTMKWWNDLWLNEGFATYMSYKGVHHIYPSWSYTDQFVSRSLYSALHQDSAVYSRSIVFSARTATEIKQMFSAISYSKGASVLRMLEALMGKDFKRGISAYLETHAYGSVDTDDLWIELTKVSTQGLDVKSLMNSWIKQINYPFINITRDKVDPTKITVSQHRYVLESNSTVWENFSADSYMWQIPLTYQTSNSSTLQFVMLNSSTLTMNLPDAEWTKFNANFTGYYLVNYEIEDWYRFKNLLFNEPSKLSQTDRANLLYDAFALAKAGHLPFEVPLNLSTYLHYETEVVPWSIAKKIFDQFQFFEHDDTREVFREYVTKLSKGLYKKLAWKDTADHSEKILRDLLTDISCKHKNYDCLKQTKQLFQRWLNGESINAEYRHLVYFYGIEGLRDEKTFRKMWDKYLNETNYDEKMDILRGLTNIRNYSLYNWLLENAENESYVARDDYLDFLTNLNRNPSYGHIIFDYMVINWDKLISRFTANSRRIAKFVKNVCSDISSLLRLKQVVLFFKKHSNTGIGSKERAEVLERISNNVDFSEKYRKTINIWLYQNVYMPWFDFRLPNTTIPLKYDLHIHPNITTEIFHGEVNVTLLVKKPTDYMVIHITNLDVTLTEIVHNLTFEKVKIDDTFLSPLRDVWVIRFQDKIDIGGYILFMKYSGVIKVSSYLTKFEKGVLKDSYINNITKENVPFFYTTFEPTNARKFFPCFDEPSMKATFRLAIVHESYHTAISNMPEEHNFTRPDGLIETQFMESVVMSTYLLCVVISDFTYKEVNITHGKKLRYFAQPDRINDTLHTLQIAPIFLQVLEEYYDIPYHLPKLDFVAIPNFPSGGMENWGLIEYKAELLVSDNKPWHEVVNSDRVVAHELAHMWFGNLVTMCWWNDIWLNEGFSSFAMSIPLRHFYEEADEIAALYFEDGRTRDANAYSHPIIHSVSNPHEIRRMFDAISYRKGSAILTMLSSYMKDDFRKGVRNYIKKYAFRNAETDDFFNELSQVSAKEINITDIMDTWTRQRGYPYIEIEVNEDNFLATQRAFLSDPEIEMSEEMKGSVYGSTWKIPLTFKNIDTGEEQRHWFVEEKTTFPLNASVDDCLKFNVNYSGYYIIKYDEKGWDCLSKKLQNNHKVFAAVDRINILFDSFLLARAGHIMYDIPLELTKYMKKERNYGPWESAKRHFFYVVLEHLKSNSRTLKLFQNYSCYLIDDVYEDILQNSTTHSNLDHVINEYARFSLHPKFVESRVPELNRWLRGEGLPSEFGFTGIIPQHENETIWQKLWDDFTNKNLSSSNKSNVLSALTAMEGKEFLQKTFDLALSDETLSKSDVIDILSRLLYNPAIGDTVWDFIKSNWSAIQNWRPSSGLNELIGSRKETRSTEAELEDLIETVKLHEIELSNVKYYKKKLRWLKRNEETIANWIYWNLPTKDNS